jgi:hypothetical protein
MGRFQTYPFTLCHCQIVTTHINSKRTHHSQYTQKRLQNATKKNPDFPETTRMKLNSNQTSKKGDNNSESEIFSITNIFKRYKITYLTRPNEFGTMMNKLATRSTERTQLWKRLRAPSRYSAEHTLLSYIVFFKEGAQCIQDWCQWHNVTTRTR